VINLDVSESTMAIFVRMSKKMPAWLPEAREFCRKSGIKILGWGPDMLTVEAKSEDRAKEIASQLAQLGFKPIRNEDDDYAGLLDLSKNPEAIHAKITSLDISRRRWVEQIVPLIWAFVSLAALFADPHVKTVRYPYWVTLPIGLLAMVLFLREGGRIWGWRLEILPDQLRVRRYYRWSTIPWTQIHAVETRTRYVRGAGQTTVTLSLASSPPFRVGTFDDPFARILRDRLRKEITQRQSESK
jgi:hypothetical protein